MILGENKTLLVKYKCFSSFKLKYKKESRKVFVENFFEYNRATRRPREKQLSRRKYNRLESAERKRLCLDHEKLSTNKAAGLEKTSLNMWMGSIRIQH